jgi:hypothetical protein
MSELPIADQEMVRQIQADVKTPELRSLLLQIVSDQRISDNARERLTAYLTGQRPRKTRPEIRDWVKNTFQRP